MVVIVMKLLILFNKHLMVAISLLDGQTLSMVMLQVIMALLVILTIGL